MCVFLHTINQSCLTEQLKLVYFKHSFLPEKETDTNTEHFAHIIPPHSLQWCLRRATLNCLLQRGQNFTSLSAIHGTRLLSKAVKEILGWHLRLYGQTLGNKGPYLGNTGLLLQTGMTGHGSKTYELKTKNGLIQSQ